VNNSATSIGAYYPRRLGAGRRPGPSFLPVVAPQRLAGGSGHSCRRWGAGLYFPFTQPLRQKSPYSHGVATQQALQVQHARSCLAWIPRWTLPPVLPACGLQAELQHPQPGQAHEQRLRGPLDRLPRPRPALFPTQTLFQVPETVLLAETGAEQLDHLHAAQGHGCGHQRETLPIAFHLGHHHLHDAVGARYVPQGTAFLPTNLSQPSVDKGSLLTPRSRPATALPQRGNRPRWPGRRSSGGKSYKRASCRNRVSTSTRGDPSVGSTSGRNTFRKA
jgi:hypothetical protein